MTNCGFVNTSFYQGCAHRHSCLRQKPKHPHRLALQPFEMSGGKTMPSQGLHPLVQLGCSKSGICLAMRKHQESLLQKAGNCRLMHETRPAMNSKQALPNYLHDDTICPYIPLRACMRSINLEPKAATTPPITEEYLHDGCLRS